MNPYRIPGEPATSAERVLRFDPVVPGIYRVSASATPVYIDYTVEWRDREACSERVFERVSTFSLLVRADGRISVRWRWSAADGAGPRVRIERVL